MAIAFDNGTGNYVVAQTSATESHTTSGADRVMLVSVLHTGGVHPSGITYAGTALTQIGAGQSFSSPAAYRQSLWYLIAPNTGTNDVVISSSSSGNIFYGIATYTGVSQIGFPDDFENDAATASSITGTIVPTVDNCWAVMGASSTGPGSFTTGVNRTIPPSGFEYSIIADNNAAINPAASTDLVFTRDSGTGDIRSTIISMAPVAAGPVAPTVTTQAVTSITETTATGNGNVTADGGATITERGVCWNTSTGPTTANSTATSAGTTGAFTAAMTGLSASTLYYVRAYAINSEGTSYGSEVTFTTDAANLITPLATTDKVFALDVSNTTNSSTGEYLPISPQRLQSLTPISEPTAATDSALLWMASGSGTKDTVAYAVGDVLLTIDSGGTSKTTLIAGYSAL